MSFRVKLKVVKNFLEYIYKFSMARTIVVVYKIMKWFELEVTFKGHVVQLPCNEQGHLSLEQVTKSSIQPGLEYSLGLGMHQLSGQPMQMPHHLQHTQFLISRTFLV